MDSLLNNREIAIAIWLTIFIVVVGTQKTVRKSAKDVLEAFLKPKLYIPLLLSFLPVLLVIGILAYFELWDLSVLKETIYWLVGTGLIMFGRFSNVQNAKQFFKQTAKDTLKLIIVLEFIINVYVFALWIELILIPLTTFVFLLSVVAEYQKGSQYDPVRKFLNWLKAAIGLLIITFALIALLQNPKPLFTYQSLELFLLPIVLSFAYAPSVYLIALYSKYGLVFNRIDHFLSPRIKNKRSLKLACIGRCKLSVYLAGEMVRHLAINLNTDTSKAQAKKLISEFDPIKDRAFL